MDLNHVLVERLDEQLVHFHRRTKCQVSFNRTELLIHTMFNNSGPLTDIKLIPDSLAIAFANKVLPEKQNPIDNQREEI
jgi:hypothetical protein